MSTFQDKYNNLPGDIQNVGARVPGCAADPQCSGTPGDGDGHVTALAGAVPFLGPSGESHEFFPQLAAADLITGISTSFPTPATSNVNWKGDYPAAQIGGGFLAGYWAGGVNPSGGVANPANAIRSGHYLALYNNPGAAVPNAAGNAITPNQAYRIDSKIDDGSPLTGSVFPAGSNAGDVVGCITAAAGVYNEVLDTNVCNLYIRFHQ